MPQFCVLLCYQVVPAPKIFSVVNITLSGEHKTPNFFEVETSTNNLTVCLQYIIQDEWINLPRNNILSLVSSVHCALPILSTFLILELTLTKLILQKKGHKKGILSKWPVFRQKVRLSSKNSPFLTKHESDIGKQRNCEVPRAQKSSP